ncbi:hypothetical protein BD413DRAFT_202104 [Trametes elegans]|nr:hypothetical protein BD413DRAFT_202104 [Trametes elegans]
MREHGYAHAPDGRTAHVHTHVHDPTNHNTPLLVRTSTIFNLRCLSPPNVDARTPLSMSLPLSHNVLTLPTQPTDRPHPHLPRLPVRMLLLNCRTCNTQPGPLAVTRSHPLGLGYSRKRHPRAGRHARDHRACIPKQTWHAVQCAKQSVLRTETRDRSAWLSSQASYRTSQMSDPPTPSCT